MESQQMSETAIRLYGQGKDAVEVPNLMELQIDAYSRFLQAEVHYSDRENVGLEAILREIFPIKSYDGKISLNYVGYELGRPRYTQQECHQLHLTYGMPFKIRLRLEKEEPIEEEVYLGEMPIMIGGGEFIVNGAERVIVSQLHRSPGVDFSEEIHTSEKRLHSCRVIPERGSWIELNVTKKDSLTVRIDQSGKFAATTLLRAMAEEFSSNRAILDLFYKVEEVKLAGEKWLSQVKGKVCAEDIVEEATGTVIVECGEIITETIAQTLFTDKEKRKVGGKDRVVRYIPDVRDPLILNTLKEDLSKSHEDALIRIYQRLRPGNPSQLAKAKELFYDKFFNPAKYRLGRVGRFRINRKFGTSIPETELTLHKEDLVNAIQYIIKLRTGEGEIDDIDHLGNRRVRTIEELAGEELRKGFLKLKRTVQERMSLMEKEALTPRSVINSKTISSAIEFFFGRGELSQVVDQTNPLSQLTHERRLSALGPGGLNRKRAGFEVRDVHISHYGRICPIETPEGTNIGLISSLGVYAKIDEYGFLVTPYLRVKSGKVTGEVVYLRADEEENRWLAPADIQVEKSGKISGDYVLARYNGDFKIVDSKVIEYMDISPRQMVGVSAALIPFLEHDDANRALMGSNMQRQAVPLVKTDPALISTGMETAVAQFSGMVVTAEAPGVVTGVDAREIHIDDRVYRLRKFEGLNERTCLNQRPVVKAGDRVKKGQIIADGAGTHKGELALGRNILVAFMSWDGYNFEDAILVSERLVKEDAYTSVHIDEFEVEIRETKLGREEFTREIPNVSERMLKNLDENGVVRIGTRVKQGDILVGKVVPKSKSELSPEEKLLHAIFGRAGEDVKNDSLEVPSGVEGVVIGACHFSRKSYSADDSRKRDKQKIAEVDQQFAELLHEQLDKLVEDLGGILGKKPTGEDGKQVTAKKLADLESVAAMKVALAPEVLISSRTTPKKAQEIKGCLRVHFARLEEIEDQKSREINRLTRGDELPPGVLEMVKVYVATKRNLSVGDKMAGRHGNKGVIAKILPVEDMPFLEDGTAVDIVLNPLGVPSRMNLGQILETHLGLAARKLGFRAITPVFDGCREEEIREALKEAGYPEDGKLTLYDGRTGQPFEQPVTVGYIYMMKLHHLVDDKIHARATGPYSLITQQPLGGKARFGGQRFGEMEVWALEAYGAASVLQELLTVKSDDVDGRAKIYESMVKGENTLEPGTPVSFDVLTHEIKGLGLNLELHKKRGAPRSIEE
ncbi:MAG: DNA-directed RNA polymerase subunit beta [Planctomycetes bacterium]|nr:DNA-directed RNA polymerase subunit beta [Planctomycetota bacterium]